MGGSFRTWDGRYGGSLPSLHTLPCRAIQEAALAERQHGVRTLYTRDADFRKFPSLDVRDPFTA
jgi:hypothetical protein